MGYLSRSCDNDSHSTRIRTVGMLKGSIRFHSHRADRKSKHLSLVRVSIIEWIKHTGTQ